MNIAYMFNTGKGTNSYRKRKSFTDRKGKSIVLFEFYTFTLFHRAFFFSLFFFSLPLPKIFLNSRKNRYVPLNCVHQCRAWPGRVGQCVTVVWHIPGVIRTHVCVCICVCVRACASVCSPCEFLETGVRLHLSVATFISMDLHKT